MTYEELVEKVTKYYEGASAKRVDEHVAIQVNVEGEAEGAFYIEIANNFIDVQPFEYFDRDVMVVTTAEVLSNIADGKLSVNDAYADGKLRAVAGDAAKVLALTAIEVKKAKKTAAKKTTAKTATKTTDKKTTTKAAAKKAEAEAAVAAKKAAAANTAPANAAPAASTVSAAPASAGTN